MPLDQFTQRMREGAEGQGDALALAKTNLELLSQELGVTEATVDAVDAGPACIRAVLDSREWLIEFTATVFGPSIIAVDLGELSCNGPAVTQPPGVLLQSPKSLSQHIQKARV